MKVVAAFFVCSSLRSFQRRRRQMFFLSDSWHLIENQTKHVSTLKKMLKPGGEIIIWLPQEIGPPMQMKLCKDIPHKPVRVNQNSPEWGLTPLAPQRVESEPMIHGPLANKISATVCVEK